MYNWLNRHHAGLRRDSAPHGVSLYLPSETLVRRAVIRGRYTIQFLAIILLQSYGVHLVPANDASGQQSAGNAMLSGIPLIPKQICQFVEDAMRHSESLRGKAGASIRRAQLLALGFDAVRFFEMHQCDVMLYEALNSSQPEIQLAGAEALHRIKPRLSPATQHRLVERLISYLETAEINPQGGPVAMSQWAVRGRCIRIIAETFQIALPLGVDDAFVGKRCMEVVDKAKERIRKARSISAIPGDGRLRP